MANSYESLRPPIPVSNRLPITFIEAMERYDYLFGPFMGPYTSFSFADRAGLIALTAEKIYALGLSPNGSFLFNDQGQLNPKMTRSDISRAEQEQILNGVVIVNVGGIEAIPLYRLGANATFIDKTLQYTGLRNLESVGVIMERLSANTAAQIGEVADVVMSSLVFSRGSLMDAQTPDLLSLFTEEERILYETYLRLSLSITKPGGINLHDGEAMFEVAERVTDVAALLEIHQTPSGKIRPYSSNIFVLQKK